MQTFIGDHLAIIKYTFYEVDFTKCYITNNMKFD